MFRCEPLVLVLTPTKKNTSHTSYVKLHSSHFPFPITLPPSSLWLESEVCLAEQVHSPASGRPAGPSWKNKSRVRLVRRFLHFSHLTMGWKCGSAARAGGSRPALVVQGFRKRRAGWACFPYATKKVQFWKWNQCAVLKLTCCIFGWWSTKNNCTNYNNSRI